MTKLFIQKQRPMFTGLIKFVRESAFSCAIVYY